MRRALTVLCLLCCPPQQDLIVSNSEDKSLRVWDMSKRIGVQVGAGRGALPQGQPASLGQAGCMDGLLVAAGLPDSPALHPDTGPRPSGASTTAFGS